MLTRTFSTLKNAYKKNIYVLLVYHIILNLFYTYIIVLFVLFLFQLEFMVQYKDITNLLALNLLIIAVFTSRETKIKIIEYIVGIVVGIINFKIHSKFDNSEGSKNDNKQK